MSATGEGFMAGEVGESPPGCGCDHGCGGVARRKVVQALGVGFLGTCVGWLGGCINVRRHLLDVRAQGKAHVLIPAAVVAKLKTTSDVLEVRAKGLETPIFVRQGTGGSLVALSSVCTHRSCELDSTPHSYDCPCHGSRFDLEGKVLAGPATTPLPRYALRPTPKGLVLTLPAA